MKKIFVLLGLLFSLNSCYYLLDEMLYQQRYIDRSYYLRKPEFKLVCNFRMECGYVNVNGR